MGDMSVFFHILRRKLCSKVAKIKSNHRALRKNEVDTHGAPVFAPDYSATVFGAKMCTNSQSCFNKVGHLLVCKQSKRGQEPQIFYSYFVMSQLYETEIL